MTQRMPLQVREIAQSEMFGGTNDGKYICILIHSMCLYILNNLVMEMVWTFQFVVGI